MSSKIIERIIKESGGVDLVALLGEQMSASDLQSLLLEVFRVRATAQTPRQVFEQYAQNSFVRPTPLDAVALLKLDQLAFSLAAPLFEPLELSPLAPLGTCSALAPVDQNKVVSAIRNVEVVSDSTNVLALECALRRKEQRNAKAEAAPVRLCATHRLTRGQRFPDPKMRPHFRLFATCTAGRSSGLAEFEVAALMEQLTFYLQFMAGVQEQGYKFNNLRIMFTPLGNKDARETLQSRVIEPLAERFPEATLAIDPDPKTQPGYYSWVRFMIFAHDTAGADYMVGDGGFTNWTQQLLSDKRERLLTGCVATERIVTLFANG